MNRFPLWLRMLFGIGIGTAAMLTILLVVAWLIGHFSKPNNRD